MSQSSAAPTYDKSHYSWAAPSTQSSQSIIKSSGEAAEKTGDSTAEEQSPRIPIIPRRSSYNYAQDSAQFSNLGNNPPAGKAEEASASHMKEKVADKDVEGLQRKLFHERKKSYTMEDQKRMQHQFMLRDGKNPQSFSES